jgi:hypothetical protein
LASHCTSKVERKKKISHKISHKNNMLLREEVTGIQAPKNKENRKRKKKKDARTCLREDTCATSEELEGDFFDDSSCVISASKLSISPCILSTFLAIFLKSLLRMFF